MICIGYRSYFTIIKELSRNERSFLQLSHGCDFGNDRIDHLTDLLHYLQMLTKYVIKLVKNLNFCAN